MILGGNNSNSGLSSRVVFLTLLVLIGVIYGNSVKNPFYYDDYILIRDNNALASLKNLRYVFVKKKYFELFRQPTYRPVTAILYILMYPVLGTHSSYWRLFNLLIHLANSFLLYLVLRRFKLNEWFSLLAAAIFAAHTVHTELINVITYNADLIGSFLCLFAFYGYFQKTRTWYFLSVSAYLLSCFTKETFIVLPALIFIFAWFHAKDKFGWREHLLSQLGFGAMILVYLFINFSLMKNPQPIFQASYPGGTLLSALMTFAVVIFYYLKIFLVPTGLTPVYSFPTYSNLLSWPVSASMSGLALITGLIIYGFSHRKAFAPHLSWFFLFLLPTSNIIPFWEVVAERFCYFPFMGLIPGVLFLGKFTLEKLGFRGDRPLILVGLLFLVFLSVLTIRRNVVWQSPQTLWQDTQRKNPKTLKPQYNLGQYYQSRQDYQRAILHYNLAARAFPQYPQTFFNLGNIYIELGDLNKARENFEKAAARKDKFIDKSFQFDVLYNLGLVCDDLADYDAAFKYWQQAQELNPDNDGVNYNLEEVSKKLKR